MDANLIKSTTVYGDHQNPDRASVFYALHPTSGRWWKKTRAMETYGWRECVTEVAWNPSGEVPASLVRMHRQRKPVMARAAYLPAYDGRTPHGVKHIPYYGAGRTPRQDMTSYHQGLRLRMPDMNQYRDQPSWPVAIQSHHNCRCAADFVFTPTHPLQYVKEEPPMNTSSARAQSVAANAYVPADAFTVGARFNAGDLTTYHYLTQDRRIEKGDTLLVWSPRSDCLAAATVVAVGTTLEGVKHAHEWIVSRVDPQDVQAYRDRKEKAKARAALDAQIERATRQAQEKLEARALAQFDPALRALLEQRDRLDNPTAGLSLAEMAAAFDPRNRR